MHTAAHAETTQTWTLHPKEVQLTLQCTLQRMLQRRKPEPYTVKNLGFRVSEDTHTFGEYIYINIHEYI